MATIRDVAKQAGVSTATVSHVLNNTRFVMPETRQLVLEAVKALNYRPSAVARGLTTNSTSTIGVVIADVTSPFFAFLLQEIETLLDEQRYNIFVCNTYENPEREAHNLGRLLDQRVDGVILTPTGATQPIFEQFHAHQTPLVFIDRQPPDATGSFVGTDNVEAAYRATRYLVELGHRRIALVTLKPETLNVSDRHEGYHRALHDSGLAFDESLIATSKMDIDDACRATLELLDAPERPTALIASSHPTTLGVLQAFQMRSLRYPDDLSLLCFDNSRWTPLLSPPITVMHKPIKALAEQAVSILLEHITARAAREPNQDALTPRRVLLENELIVRESCRRLG